MPSPQRLMDSLGPPPPDVCLDWAWQLHELVDGNLHYKLDWWQLEVLESGELLLNAPDAAELRASPGYPAAAAAAEPRVLDLIDELLSWSCSDSSNALAACESSPTTAEDLLYRLEQRTREVIQPAGSARLAMPQRMEGGHASSPQPLATSCQPEQQVFPGQPPQTEEPVLTKQGGPAEQDQMEQPSRQELPGLRTKADNGHKSIKRKPATAAVWRGVWLGGVAAIGLGLALTVGSLFWPGEDAERFASTPNVIPQAARDIPHDSDLDDGSTADANQPIAVAELSTLAESWDPSAPGNPRRIGTIRPAIAGTGGSRTGHIRLGLLAPIACYLKLSKIPRLPRRSHCSQPKPARPA